MELPQQPSWQENVTATVRASLRAHSLDKLLGGWRVAATESCCKGQELPTSNQLGVPEASLRVSVTFLKRKFNQLKAPVTGGCKGWRLMASAVGAKEVPKMGTSKQMRR